MLPFVLKPYSENFHIELNSDCSDFEHFFTVHLGCFVLLDANNKIVIFILIEVSAVFPALHTSARSKAAPVLFRQAHYRLPAAVIQNISTCAN